MPTTPLKPSASRILFVETLCSFCEVLKSHLALSAFTFVLNESGGIVFSELGAPLKGAPSSPKLAQDVRPWSASSSTAESANRNTASCQDAGTTLRSRPRGRQHTSCQVLRSQGSSWALILEVSWPPLWKGEISLQMIPDTGYSAGNCRLPSRSPRTPAPKGWLAASGKALWFGCGRPSSRAGSNCHIPKCHVLHRLLQPRDTQER